MKRMFKYHSKRLNKLDEVTRFRVITLSVFIVLGAVISPIYMQYFHLLNISINDITITAASIIAFFGLAREISLKFINYVMKRTKPSMILTYMISIVILYIISNTLYFYNIKIMLWMDMFLGVISVLMFSVYNSILNNYIVYFHKDTYTFFQDYRNSINAEAGILGGLLSLALNAIDVKYGVLFAIGLGTWLMIYQIRNIAILKKYDFRYMLNYKKKLKK